MKHGIERSWTGLFCSDLTWEIYKDRDFLLTCHQNRGKGKYYALHRRRKGLLRFFTKHALVVWGARRACVDALEAVKAFDAGRIAGPEPYEWKAEARREGR